MYQIGTDMYDTFFGCSALNRVTLGARFAWVGTNGYLPEPTGGVWYNEATGQAYAPADIPNNTAATYVTSL